MSLTSGIDCANLTDQIMYSKILLVLFALAAISKTHGRVYVIDTSSDAGNVPFRLTQYLTSDYYEQAPVICYDIFGNLNLPDYQAVNRTGFWTTCQQSSSQIRFVRGEWPRVNFTLEIEAFHPPGSVFYLWASEDLVLGGTGWRTHRIPFTNWGSNSFTIANHAHYRAVLDKITFITEEEEPTTTPTTTLAPGCNRELEEEVECSPGVQYLPHPSDPARFIICTNGVPSVECCPEGTLWDQSLTTCNHPRGILFGWE